MCGDYFCRPKWPIFAAMFLLAVGIALPSKGAAQSDTGMVDIVKPDSAKTQASPAGVSKPASGPDAAKPGEPTDPKARKTYAEALDWEHHKFYNEALDSFRRANKQDGGQCWECLRRAYSLALKLGAYKDGVAIARDMMPLTQTDSEKGNAHFLLAMCLHQDAEARARFSEFLEDDTKNPSLHERAERFQDRIDLARATMAPPFMVTTLDGQHISMDSLAGKVVLIDFWATWCGPCVNALPHMRHLAQKFDGQPLVVLSISLDNDEAKWKSFVEKNGMTWMQVRDGGFNGEVSKKFGVTAIPATFSNDADGVLEDQHVGDADIEGKLKKMIARAAEVGNRKPAPVSSGATSGSGD